MNERMKGKEKSSKYIYIYLSTHFKIKVEDKKRVLKKLYSAHVQRTFYEQNSNVFVFYTSINWDNKFNMYLPQ